MIDKIKSTFQELGYHVVDKLTGMEPINTQLKVQNKKSNRETLETLAAIVDKDELKYHGYHYGFYGECLNIYEEH